MILDQHLPHLCQGMVLLTVTPAAKAAIDAFVVLKLNSAHRDEELARLDIGSEIDHHTLASISRHLVQHTGGVAREWRLEALLKGSTVYQPPPPPRPEPVCTFPFSRPLPTRTRCE